MPKLSTRPPLVYISCWVLKIEAVMSGRPCAAAAHADWPALFSAEKKAKQLQAYYEMLGGADTASWAGFILRIAERLKGAFHSGVGSDKEKVKRLATRTRRCQQMQSQTRGV